VLSVHLGFIVGTLAKVTPSGLRIPLKLTMWDFNNSWAKSYGYSKYYFMWFSTT